MTILNYVSSIPKEEELLKPTEEEKRDIQQTAIDDTIRDELVQGRTANVIHYQSVPEQYRDLKPRYEPKPIRSVAIDERPDTGLLRSEEGIEFSPFDIPREEAKRIAIKPKVIKTPGKEPGLIEAKPIAPTAPTVVLGLIPEAKPTPEPVEDILLSEPELQTAVKTSSLMDVTPKDTAKTTGDYLTDIGFQVKKGVNMLGVHEDFKAVGTQLQQVFDYYDIPEPHRVITSGVRDKGDWSLHNTGDALDFRLKYTNAEIARQIATDLQERLGPAFYVLAHGEGNNYHLHVQRNAGRNRLMEYAYDHKIRPEDIKNVKSRKAYIRWLMETNRG